MANLFDILPRGFFNYLASNAQNRIYADCLELIYHAYDREVSYRIPRSQLRDILALYFLENHVEVPEDMEEAGNTDVYQVASGILRRLSDVNVRWLEEDSDEDTYEKQIIMSEQGIALSEFLQSLRKPEREEYAGYIITIYSVLQNQELLREHPYLDVLRPVHRQAKLLARSLKRLATFIRRVIEEMVKEDSLEKITENLIAYCDGSFIREYTRLTRQQNIHAYRSVIRERLEEIRENEPLMQRMTEELMQEEDMNRTEAGDMIDDMIRNTVRFLYDDYDQIMSEIKQKINLYMQLHIGHLRYLQNRGADARSVVEQVIRHISEETDGLNKRDYLPEEMQNLFQLGGMSYVDTASLRYPRRTQRVQESSEDVIEELSDDALAKAREEQLREANNPYSQKKMRDYLDSRMQGRESLKADDLPMDTKEDLLSILAAVAFAGDSGYQVKTADTYVETDSFSVREFEIRRGKGNGRDRDGT